MDYGLDGKLALVIGGSSGIGLATSQALLAEGATVVVMSRAPTNNSDFTNFLTKQNENKRLFFKTADYSLHETMSRAIHEVHEEHGNISIFVGSSGGPPPVTALDIDFERLAVALQSNLIGVISATAQVLPGMLEQKWGRIVYVTTSGVKQALPNLAYSNISRTGLAAYAKTLAAEVASHGITVNTVMPGKISTRRLAQITHANAQRKGISDEEQEALDVKEIPAARYGYPSEIANVITFLASTAASYITGSHLAVDGGYIRS